MSFDDVVYWNLLFKGPMALPQVVCSYWMSLDIKIGAILLAIMGKFTRGDLRIGITICLRLKRWIPRQALSRLG